MSSYKKFIDKLQKSPCLNNISFDDAYNFLTSDKVGFKAFDNGGSHCQFRKKGVRPLTIPRRTLKEYNIKQILVTLEEMGLI